MVSRGITDKQGRQWSAVDAGGSAAATGYTPAGRKSRLVRFDCLDDPDEPERWESFRGDDLSRLTEDQLRRLLHRSDGPPNHLEEEARKIRQGGGWADIEWDSRECVWVLRWWQPQEGRGEKRAE